MLRRNIFFHVRLGHEFSKFFLETRVCNECLNILDYYDYLSTRKKEEDNLVLILPVKGLVSMLRKSGLYNYSCLNPQLDHCPQKIYFLKISVYYVKVFTKNILVF